jgi:hypothetical protein
MSRGIEHTRTALVGLACVVMVLTLSAGDALFEQLHAGLGHHGLHLALPLAAFVVFATLVAHDVRRHGWPVFSWRL